MKTIFSQIANCFQVYKWNHPFCIYFNLERGPEEMFREQTNEMATGPDIVDIVEFCFAIFRALLKSRQ